MNTESFETIIGQRPCILNNVLDLYPSTIERFLSRISPDPVSGCWIWTGWQQALYGAFQFKPGEFTPKTWKAHKLAYSLAYGLPKLGYQLHHKCQHKLCCNPDHLVPLTPQEHGLEEQSLLPKRTHCLQGHLFTEETTIHHKGGRRQCRICVNARNKEIYRAVFGPPKPKITHCKNGHEFTEENTYWYTTHLGYKARQCRACQTDNRRRTALDRRQRVAALRPFIEPKTTHCFNGHCYEEVGWTTQPTGEIRCRQCTRDTVNRKNAIRRKDAVPKTHCVKGHDLSIHGYQSPRGGHRLICRLCFGHKKKNLLPDGTLNFGGRIDPNAQPTTNESGRETQRSAGD